MNFIKFATLYSSCLYLPQHNIEMVQQFLKGGSFTEYNICYVLQNLFEII